jgi:hypothetical protein
LGARCLLGGACVEGEVSEVVICAKGRLEEDDEEEVEVEE